MTATNLQTHSQGTDHRSQVMQSLWETADEGFWLVDAAGLTTDMNPAMCRLLGRPLAAVLGKPFFDFVERKARDEVRRAFSLRQIGEKTTYQVALERPDGSKVHCIKSGTPIFDGAGKMVAAVGLWTDITPLRMAEGMQRQLTAAIDGLREAVILTDAEDRIVFFNRRYRDLNADIVPAIEVGKPYIGVIRALAKSRILPEAVGRESEWVEERIRLRRNPGPAIEQQREDGSWFLIHDQRLPDGGTATVLTEITAQKQAEKELRENQDRIVDFAASGADWFWEQDADLRFVDVSVENAEFTGMSAQNHVGKTRRETGPEVSEEALRAHEMLLEQHLPFVDFRFSRTRPDGKRVHLSTSGRPRFDAEGKFLGYRGIGRNITELVETQERLIASEARFRDFAASTSDYFWETDRNHRFTEFSADTSPLIGLPSDHLVGKTRKEISVDLPYPTDKWESHAADLEAHRPFRDFRYAIAREDGAGVEWVSVSGVPVFNGEGGFVGYRGTATRVTESVAAAQALEKATREAETANAAKSEFLSSMSHELRTPLNAILGFAQLLQGEVQPEHRRAVEHILRGGDHLLGLINQVLDFSQIETGTLHLHVEFGSVAEEVAQALQMIEALAAEKKVVVRDRTIGLEALKFAVDRTRFRQVLLHLLSNAVKFNSKQGSVTLTSELEPKMIRFTVADTGRGIEPHRAHRLFQPFDRLGIEASEIEGVGIGLVLSKRIVEAMGGEIGYAPNAGGGSRFWFTLPCERPELSTPRKPEKTA